MKMPIDYVSTVDPVDCNETASPAPTSGGTIKYHVDETEKFLRETEVLLDRLIEFLWTENDMTPPCTINVCDLNSAVINNYIMALGVRDRVQVICDRIGVVM